MSYRKAESGGGAITVADSMRFALSANRDSYFATNPSRLKADAYCTVNGELQKYNGTSWENVAVVIEGKKGDSAPPMKLQYSASGNSGWTEAFDASIHEYWRWSIDNGVSWSANGVRFSGEDGAGGNVDLTPYAAIATYDPTGVNDNAFLMDNMSEGANAKVMTEAERLKLSGLADVKSVGAGLSLDVNGELTSQDAIVDFTPYMAKATYDPSGVASNAFSMNSMVEGANTKILTSTERFSIATISNKQDIISASNRLPVNLVGDGTKVLSENDFTTSQKDKLANIEERFLGIFADAAARDIAYPSPLNGQYCKQNDTNSFWFYGAGAWTDTGGSSSGDMLAALYDPQNVASDTFARANHTGEQAIGTITGLQSEIDKLPPLRTQVDNLDGSVNDPAVGLSKRLTDLNNQINTPATGVISRVQTLEQNSGSAITGAATTILNNNLSTNRALISDSSGKVADSIVTATEISHLDGVTSSIQTQLNGKQASITGAAGTIVTSVLTASRALASDANGKVSVSDVSLSELNRLDGIRSSVQTQLDSKQPTLKDSDNNTIQCKVVYGTFPPGATDTSYPHGLVDGDVLLGFSVVCEYSGTIGEGLRQGMPPNMTDSAGFHYQSYVSNSSAVLRPIDAVNLYNRPITFMFWYT